eukprot:jgi/Botrbrau1/21996/Bobra.0024s0012.1
MFVTRHDVRLQDCASQGPGSTGSAVSRDLLQQFAFAWIDGGRFNAPQPKFASLSFASLTGASLDGKAEPKTGTSFPARFCHLVKRNCPVLAGVGVRNKRLLGMKNIDVYSLGLYVDPSSTKRLANKYKGAAPDALAKNQKFLDELADAKGPAKTLRVFVTTKLLTSSRFFNGLRESLIPALRKVGENDSSLQSLEKLFEGVHFRRGYDLAFSSTPSGALAVQVGGTEAGKVENPKLTTAFFGLYLGSNAVSPDAKVDIGHGLVGIANS